MRFSCDNWGVESWIAPCILLQRIFENGKIIGVKPLFSAEGKMGFSFL